MPETVFVQMMVDKFSLDSQSFVLVASMGSDGQPTLLHKVGEELLTGDLSDTMWKKFGSFFMGMHKGGQEAPEHQVVSDISHRGVELTEEDADAYYEVEMDLPIPEEFINDSEEGKREKEKALMSEILNEVDTMLSVAEDGAPEDMLPKDEQNNREERLTSDLEEPAIGDMPAFEESALKDLDLKQKEKDMQKKIKAFTASPEVVTTPILQQFGLWYNLYAEILICLQCNNGIYFNSSALMGHFSDPEIIHPDYEINSWKRQRTEAFMSEAEKSLKSLDQMKRRKFFIRKHVRDFIAFQPKLEKPVFGINILDGFYCSRNTCTTAWNLSDRHKCSDTKIRGSDELTRPGHIQTLTSKFKHYFKVNNNKRDHKWHNLSTSITPQSVDSNPLQLTQSSTGGSQISFLNSLQAEIDTTMDSVLKPDRAAVNPVFEYTGVSGWLKRFPERNQISARLPAIPRLQSPSTDKRYKVLREVVLWMFAKDMGLLGGDKSHPGIGRILTNGSRCSEMRKEFTRVHDTSTASSYAAVEANMIWTFMMFLSSQPLPQDQLLFVFSEAQEKAVYRVRDELDSCTKKWTSTEKEREALAEQIRMLLELLYFPEDMPYSDPFSAQPNLQYMCYGTIKPNGDYLNIHLIPPPLAAHQYVMRLKGLNYLNRTIISEGYRDKYKNWISFAKDWVDKYLVDMCLFPFDILRRMIHGFGRVSMATPRPGVVRWDAVGESLNLFGYVIDMGKYRTCLHKTLLHLEKFILEDILLGVYKSIDEVNKTYGISSLQDNGDETTPGYGIVSELTSQGLRNKESDHWFVQVPAGKLGVGSSRQQTVTWLDNINKGKANLFVLVYCTSYAGRGSEIEKTRPLNVGTQSRRNIVYDQEAYTGAIDSDYHKGFSITGLNKHNRRYMPFSVFLLLYIFVRIVAPIELALLLHINPTLSKSVKDDIVEAYTTRLFVSLGQRWTSNTMTAVLKKWFKDNFSLDIAGISDCRHLNIAIQRRYVDLKTPVNELEKMNNQLVGHSTEVADAHYSRPTYLGSCPKIERTISLHLAQQFHGSLAFATGSNQPDPPALRQLREEFDSNKLAPQLSKAIISGVHIRNAIGETRHTGAKKKPTNAVEPVPVGPVRRTTRKITKKYTYESDETFLEDIEDEFKPEQSPEPSSASISVGIKTRKRSIQAKDTNELPKRSTRVTRGVKKPSKK